MTAPTRPRGLEKLGTSREEAARRIQAVWERANAEQLAQGREWYGHALAVAVELSEEGGVTLEQAAVVIAHLSPRMKWARNVRLARSMVLTGEAPGAFRVQQNKARAALAGSDPWASFTPGGDTKTRNFAMNIVGDPHAVTVDMWAAMVAGIEPDALSRAGVYEDVAEAYRIAARAAGVEPSVMQATTWVVARGAAD
jgi:hypothetical protein